MGTWQEDQDLIFGGPDVPEIRNRGFGQPPPPDRPAPSRRPSRYFSGDPMNFNPLQGAHAHHMAQGGMLQGMAGDAMAAIQRENESRVAQSREMRRMQHEKALEQMRINGLLARLQAEQQQQASANPLAMGFRQDPGTREWMRT